MLERSKSTLSRVLDGVRAPMRGADFLLRHPTLTRYAMAPLLLSFVLLVLLLWLTVTTLLVPFHDWLVGLLHLGTWLQWLIELILWPAAIALYLILASFSFTALANLLAGPFNERLSQRTEELATGKAESDVFSVREAFSRLWASMAVQFKKIGFFVLLQILLLGVWAFPVLGPILHTVLAGLVTIWFLATEYLDYPLERRRVAFRSRLLFTWVHRYEILGFGAAIAVWLTVPVLNFTALPVSVVGGTLLYLQVTEA